MSDEEVRKIIDLQLDAYNEQDLDRLCSYYAADCEICNLTGVGKVIHGLPDVRELYHTLFTKYPRNRVKITSRITQDEFVIDQEFVMGRDPDRTDYHATAIYLVRDGFIKKVWFVK